jgi:glycosyltransferase involved in cell wall biosynthesis
VNEKDLELTIVMPCLNEAETLERCIEKAQRSLRTLSIPGEVVIADNGSTDGSQRIAERMGARVVPVKEKGYGSALRGGVASARGKFVIMGDSDDSYDFSSIEPFVEALRGGADLVMGNRFKGAILPGAMPWKHRWIGNPVLTTLGRIFFRSPVGDFHCGLRGFRKDAFERMELQTTGMEFASEMVIKSTLLGLKITEVPITLHKDGRSRPPHLRSWRDGWRHLRFMLLFSPLWLFLIPGTLMALTGLVTGAALYVRPFRIGGVEFDIHTLLASACLCTLGYQLIIFALFTKTFAITQGLHPRYRPLEWAWKYVNLEIGLVLGAVLLAAGLLVATLALDAWRAAEFRTLEPRQVMRQMIPAVTLLTVGAQTIFASFFLSILGLRKKSPAVSDRPEASSRIAEEQSISRT